VETGFGHDTTVGGVTSRVAFIRGINVGGNRKLPMAELRALLAGIGFGDVRTYIQSGNVVYSPPRRASDRPTTLAREAATISAAIDARHGFEPMVMVFPARVVAEHLERSPFFDTDPARTFIAFVDGDPEALAPLVTIGREEAAIIDGAIHLHLPDGAGRSKLAARLAGATAPATTARNLRTIRAVLDLAGVS
jgi:uncharacterized protein (DUF1697 family)